MALKEGRARQKQTASFVASGLGPDPAPAVRPGAGGHGVRRVDLILDVRSVRCGRRAGEIAWGAAGPVAAGYHLAQNMYRDSTANLAREKLEEAKAKRRRPRKGEARPRVSTRLQWQTMMTLDAPREGTAAGLQCRYEAQ